MCSKKQTPDGLFFNCAKLGKQYGNDVFPKILVIGKEPVTENRQVTPTASLQEANNPHYRRTLYTLATLLQDRPTDASENSLASYEYLLDYFCLTNYFKCSFTKTEKVDSRKKAEKNSNVSTNAQMRRNCLEILLDEIEVLTPNVIVMQGTVYHEDFYKKLRGIYGDNEICQDEGKVGSIELTKHRYTDGSPLYIVWAYHPTARGKYSWHKQWSDLEIVLNKIKKEWI